MSTHADLRRGCFPFMTPLQTQLDQLDTQIALRPEALELRVRRSVLATMLARQRTAQPLPRLLAQVAVGEVAPETAAARIVAEPALAGELRAAVGVHFGQNNTIANSHITVGDITIIVRSE